MERLELMLVAVLIALALLIGILFGGSSIWFLKPSYGGASTVERTVNKYVCYDGSVRDVQTACPVVSSGVDGKTSVVCPPCPAVNAPKECSPFRQCDCVQCSAQCGSSGATTTTITPPPVCRQCSVDSDCGQPSYSEIRCKNDEAYKMYTTPFCDDDKFLGGRCCKANETYVKIQTCPDGQRCVKGSGCEVWASD